MEDLRIGDIVKHRRYESFARVVEIHPDKEEPQIKFEGVFEENGTFRHVNVDETCWFIKSIRLATNKEVAEYEQSIR